MGEKIASFLYFPVWFVLAVRLLHLSLVRSWFVPDEYWQSLEVAHHIVFDYGYLTWEWTEGLRSYLYVVFVAAQYYLLKWLHLDYVQLLIVVPRLVQTLISTLADLCLLHWISLMTCRSVATLAGIFLLSAFCVAYCATRTLINTVEMNLACFALYVYPWPQGARKRDRIYLWIVAFSCLLRPTSCILWLPLCLYDIGRSPSPCRRIMYDFLPVGFLSMIVSTLLDSWLHKAWTLTPWNFLRINVVSGVSSHYSVQPWYWYLTSGVPSVWGSLTVPLFCYVVKTVYQGRARHVILFATFVWTIFIYSCIGHKEFRFLLPLVPIMLLYTSLQVYSWLSSFSSSWVLAFISCVVVIETALLVFLSLFHQVGVLNVMPYLRENNAGGVLFLMPCHSTPLYSHLHTNISTRFLTCDPYLAPLPRSSYTDEAALFYQDPLRWLSEQYGDTNPKETQVVDYLQKNHVNSNTTVDSKILVNDTFESSGKKYLEASSEKLTDAKFSKFPDMKVPEYTSSVQNNFPSSDGSKVSPSLPSIVVCFDALVPRIQGWLKDEGYTLEREIYHTLLPLESRIGRYVMLYRRSLVSVP